jgi:tetratricopeptide (TPR) repeat protein
MVEALNQQAFNQLVRAITLSEGQFTLILARCNYAQLRDRLSTLLAEQQEQVALLTLPEHSKSLYDEIQAFICPADAAALTPTTLLISGLELLANLSAFLVTINFERPKLLQFPFPIVLWVNDDVFFQFERIATDLFTWAGASILFKLPMPEIVRSLKEHSDRLFQSILSEGDEQFWVQRQILPSTNSLRPNELQFAFQHLRANDYPIEPELQASLDFLMGREAHSRGEMETALERYESSLEFWQQACGKDDDSGPAATPEIDPDVDRNAAPDEAPDEAPDAAFVDSTPAAATPPPFHPVPYLERAASVLFYLGLWWRSYAVLQRAIYQNACLQAYDHFRRSLIYFTEENRQDLVARFIIAQAETLQKLERWDDLEELTKQAIVLHQLYRDPIRLARDYGFLAEVAIARAEWVKAKMLVVVALRTLENADAALSEYELVPDPHLEQSLELAYRFHFGWYLFLLAQAEKALGNLDGAIQHLENARDHSHPQNDPPLYVHILRHLRDFYFERGDYPLAFRTKQARRLLEHQYGFRAFIGALRLQPQQLQRRNPFPLPPQVDQQTLLAQEISASGRQQDVDRLVIRLTLPKDKLVVIHGPSGVGKSSIVNAGLIPALRDRLLGERFALPLLIDAYSDWHSAIAKQLTRLLAPPLPPLIDSSLLPYLSLATDRNFLPVLIFDQFEEFFFVYGTVQRRLPFYQFLRQCLDLPFVKVVLSLREDYLHYLLEFQRLANLEIINNDILSRDIRYPLGDFSPEDAKAVMKSLTDKAQFYLAEDLVEAVVQDLAGELGEVRPIELQVVGAQLQAESIDTLAEYLEKGPKDKLVQRSLEDVITDCGPENKEMAQLVLFLLTNENGTRPLKTRDDLEADLRDLGLFEQLPKLTLVLEVLVGSGLVFLIPDAPADCYQLVHDYLVSFIRDQQIDTVAYLKAELERERNQRQTLEADKQRIEAQIQKLTQELALIWRTLHKTESSSAEGEGKTEG